MRRRKFLSTRHSPCVLTNVLRIRCDPGAYSRALISYRSRDAVCLWVLLTVAAVLSACASSSMPPHVLVKRAVDEFGGSRRIARTPTGTYDYLVVRFKPSADRYHVRFVFDGVRYLGTTRKGSSITTTFVGPRVGWTDFDGIVSEMRSDQYLQEKSYATRTSWSALLEALNPGAKLSAAGYETLPDGLLTEKVVACMDSTSSEDLFFDPRTDLLAATGYRQVDRTTGHAFYRLNRLYFRKEYGQFMMAREEQYLDSAMVKVTTLLKFVPHVNPAVFVRPRTFVVDGTVVAPFDDSLGVPTVLVSLNGTAPQRFVIDTGADDTTLTAAAATRLGLRSARSGTAILGGQVFSMRSASLRTLRLGTAVVRDLNVSIVKAAKGAVGSDYAGTLGYNFLGRFQVTLDFPAKLLILKPRAAAAARGITIAAEIVNGTIQVTGQLGRHRIPVLLDTGSSGVLIPEATARTLRGIAVKTNEHAYASSLGAISSVFPAHIPGISLGGRRLLNSPTFVYTSAGMVPGGSSHSFADRGGLIVGALSMRGIRITIDYAREKVVLS